jgi:hypothetical protein
LSEQTLPVCSGNGKRARALKPSPSLRVPLGGVWSHPGPSAWRPTARSAPPLGSVDASGTSGPKRTSGPYGVLVPRCGAVRGERNCPVKPGCQTGRVSNRDWDKDRDRHIVATDRGRQRGEQATRWRSAQDEREQKRFFSIARRLRGEVPFCEKIMHQARITRAQARVLLQIEAEHPLSPR